MSEARTDKLQGIWAEDATVVSSTPPMPVTGTAYRNTSADATVGYQFLTKSASEISNQFLYTVSKLLDQIQVHGTLGWNATTPYIIGAMVFGSDNQLYICKEDALNKDPTSETTYWVKLDIANRALITLANISTVAAAADGAVKTAPDVVTSYWVASDGQSWYRKYKSGWLEQGGIKPATSGGATAITFPLSFANTNYVFQASPEYYRSADNTEFGWSSKTTSGISMYFREDYSPWRSVSLMWEAKGIGA